MLVNHIHLGWKHNLVTSVLQHNLLLCTLVGYGFSSAYARFFTTYLSGCTYSFSWGKAESPPQSLPWAWAKALCSPPHS